MDIPKVSILIPTYNQRNFIVRAIESAVAQTYPNLEVVVSDDCSSDDTRAVVEACIARPGFERVRYCRTPKNFGILRNYQHNLYDNASGEWAINLDGDDFFLDPDFIKEAIALASSDPAIRLVFGNYAEYFEHTGRRLDIQNRSHPRVMEPEAFYRRYADNEILWNHNAILYHRPTAIELGFYWDPQRPRNDWESFLRLIVGRKVGFLPRTAAAWVQHGANETRRLDIRKYLNNFALIKGLAEYAKGAGMTPEFVDGWYEKMIYKSARGSCIGYIRNRDFRGLVAFLRQAGKVSPRLPLKAACDPGLIARTLLGVNPSLYLKAKGLVRKFPLR